MLNWTDRLLNEQPIWPIYMFFGWGAAKPIQTEVEKC